MGRWIPEYGRQREIGRDASASGASRDLVLLLTTAVVIIAIIFGTMLLPQPTPWWGRALQGILVLYALNTGQRLSKPRR